MTLAYNYDPLTGNYISSEEAMGDPRSLGDFIVPAFATLEPPPALSEGQLARFVAGAWIVVAAPTPAEVAEQTAAEAEAAVLRKLETDAKYFLTQSDWAILPDVPLLNKAEWIAYRAALREIAIAPTLTSQIPAIPPKVWV